MMKRERHKPHKTQVVHNAVAQQPLPQFINWDDALWYGISPWPAQLSCPGHAALWFLSLFQSLAAMLFFFFNLFFWWKASLAKELFDALSLLSSQGTSLHRSPGFFSLLNPPLQPSQSSLNWPVPGRFSIGKSLQHQITPCNVPESANQGTGTQFPVLPFAFEWCCAGHTTILSSWDMNSQSFIKQSEV